MKKLDWLMFAAALLAAASANAQNAPAKPAEEPAAGEAAAAMERARRQAANPMRIILEAAKGKRKTVEPDTPAAPEPTSVRPVATRPAATQATPAAANNTGSGNTATRVAATAATAATGAAVATPTSNATPAVSVLPAAASPAPTSAVTTLAPAPVAPPAVLNSDLQAKSVTTVPALETAGSVAAPSAQALALPAAAKTLTPVDGKPRLVRMVEPELPQRLLDELGRNATVAVDLVIRANGTVAGVNVLPPAPRQMQRFLTAAMEQWRFDPLPDQRTHRVELVFNNER